MFFEKKADFFKKINCCLSLQKRLAPRIYEGGAPVRTLGRGEHKKGGQDCAPAGRAGRRPTIL